MEMTRDDEARATLEELIRFATPSHVSNAEITSWVSGQLKLLGFEVERIDFVDSFGVLKSNLVAVRHGERGPGSSGGLAYFAHTDVVPAETWDGPGGPFDPVIAEGRLYGRGSCDMKGSLAAMLSAIGRTNRAGQQHALWVVCTADEEIGFGGAKQVRDRSALFRQMVQTQPQGVIGEPTEMRVVHAHKGVTGCKLISRGRAAHSSTSEGINANLAMVPVLAEMAEIDRLTREDATLWDDRFDPPTLSWNFGVSDGARAINVTPPESKAWCSFRPMPKASGSELVERIQRVAQQHGVACEIYAGSAPLWVDPEHPWVQQMDRLTGEKGPRTASYCTDAGQFLELGALVICGPGSIVQAHTTDEFIDLAEFHRGIDMYQRIVQGVCW